MASAGERGCSSGPTSTVPGDKMTALPHAQDRRNRLTWHGWWRSITKLTRASVLVLLTAACAVTAGQEPGVPVRQVLVFIASNWVAAPPEVGYQEESAYVTLLLLEDDGQLFMMDCLLRRRPERAATVSSGDGFNLYSGDWRLGPSGGVDLTYRLRSRSVPRVPHEELPGPETHAHGQVSAGGVVVEGELFTVSREITRDEMGSYFGLSLR